MVRTLPQMRLTPRALEWGGFEWGAEAPGTTAHRLPALRAAATTAAAVGPPATVSGALPIEPGSFRCMTSFLPERNHGIDPACFACRNVAGQQCDTHESTRD